jgi:hypothetical protein
LFGWSFVGLLCFLRGKINNFFVFIFMLLAKKNCKPKNLLAKKNIEDEKYTPTKINCLKYFLTGGGGRRG